MKTNLKLLTTLGRSLPTLLLGALLAGLTAPQQAQAITHGTLDGDAHPYVGMVVFYDTNGVRMYRCTGTLISPTVFLTAGHCAEGLPDRGRPASARVYFQSEVNTNTASYVTGVPIPNPGYSESFGGGLIQPISHDVAVVILDVPLAGPYGQLAPLGTLDQLTGPKYNNLTFDVVGYGVQDWKPALKAETVRYWATPKRLTESSATVGDNYIKHSENNGQVNNGGSCNGDSGGPIFLAGTTIIVGVTSWGIDPNCAGPGFGYRTDIAESLDFLNPFLISE